MEHILACKYILKGQRIMENGIKYSYVENQFSIEYKNEPHTRPMPPHTHNAVEIFLNLSYLPSVLLDSKVLPAEKNTLIIFPSYCVHKLSSLPGEAYERYVIMADTLWLDKILGNSRKRFAYLKDAKNPMIIPVNEKLDDLINAFERYIANKSGNQFIKLARFFDIMTVVDELASGTADQRQYLPAKKISITNKTVNDIIEYINEHLFENLMIKDIAAHFYLNPDYISRIFKKHTNAHINSYITMQRIAAARQMLSEGMTITEVQQKTGYLSYSHFFRVFKKETGMTPREFRDKFFIQN